MQPTNFLLPGSWRQHTSANSNVGGPDDLKSVVRPCFAQVMPPLPNLVLCNARESSSGFHSALWHCWIHIAGIDPLLSDLWWWWLLSTATMWCCYCVKVLCVCSRHSRGHSWSTWHDVNEELTACPLIGFGSRPGAHRVQCFALVSLEQQPSSFSAKKAVASCERRFRRVAAVMRRPVREAAGCSKKEAPLPFLFFLNFSVFIIFRTLLLWCCTNWPK